MELTKEERESAERLLNSEAIHADRYGYDIEKVALAALRSPQPIPLPTHEGYYLQNLQAGYVGNSPLFWAKGGNGYTCWLDDCEVFTSEAADKMVRDDSRKWRAWPVDGIESLARRTVDMEELRRISTVHLPTALAGKGGGGK